MPVQLDRFCGVLGALPRGVALVHTANSAAGGIPLVRGGDLARPGIFLYGGEAGIEHPEPVARLSARVIAIRKLEPGDSVSYAASWHAQHPTTIATLSIGYADGVLRSLGNRGVVELNGELAPIAGRVTMDMLMVDVGTRPVRLGDTATLFGGQVNLTHRVVGRALAGEVLVTDRVCEAIAGRENLTMEPIGQVSLKGFPVPTDLFLVRAAA